ncbi:MAG: hypothetical protein VX589_14935 [Myxococcota bacterium]|nr:hypothetical protein [Myxococcota bacterium]
MWKRALSLAIICGVPSVSVAQDDPCGTAKQMINWSQPNNVPITSDNAPRWPTDASIRIAYGGLWCPTAEQVEFVKIPKNGEGEIVPIAAQLRIKTPHKIVTNATDPLTIMEIDPIEPLEARSDYRVTVRPPEPRLQINQEFMLEFRTRVGVADEFPDDFDGVGNVRLDGEPCMESGCFWPADRSDQPCPRPNRLKVAVEFQPLDRPEIAYVVYRTSSVEISDDGMGKGSGKADLTPIRIAFENGARTLIGDAPAMRKTGVFVPYYPLPRRDCFSVRAIDEYGRERGDVMNEKCIELFPLGDCGQNCPHSVGCFPEPMEAEGMDAQPGQMCETVGLNGADANVAVPDVDAEASPSDGSAAGGDGGAGREANSGGGQDVATNRDVAAGGRSTSDGNNDASLCSTTLVGVKPKLGGPICFAILCLGLLGWRRRAG